MERAGVLRDGQRGLTDVASTPGDEDALRFIVAGRATGERAGDGERQAASTGSQERIRRRRDGDDMC
jgi:hypothetical protein